VSRGPEGSRPTGVVDFAIIGSGFGGSVSALRLTEKGYAVTVLERGRRFRDQDFPQTTWRVPRYLWMPRLRCFGILEISSFKDIFALHGAGVGGGSLGYANVLMEPDERLFAHPEWKRPVAWQRLLAPHYRTARRMLGVATNPRLTPADAVLRDVAEEFGTAGTFRPTTVGAYFAPPGQEGVEVPDPYFGGEGPARRGCQYCGGCMVGCRHGAKNTLVKNYLFFAEKYGARVEPEAEVRDIRPLAHGQPDGARYEVCWRRATAFGPRRYHRLRARNVIVAAGTVGTMRLLFRCRDVTRSLPALSPRLGERIRTNNEALLGVVARDDTHDHSVGIAISSIVQVDEVTSVEPVRYSTGSSLMRFLTGPMLDAGTGARRLLAAVASAIRHPIDLLRTHVLPRWAQRTIILLVMQTEDSRLRFRTGRSPLTLFRRGVVSEPDPESPPASPIALGHRIARAFARRTGGVAAASLSEGLLGVPMTAHLLGGCPVGLSPEEGVVDLRFEVHGYPGLFAVDGSVMPGNPGVNPSLTITALAEYAMSLVPVASGRVRSPIGVEEPAAV
jgi:cholesterol oxidase